MIIVYIHIQLYTVYNVIHRKKVRHDLIIQEVLSYFIHFFIFILFDL